MSVRTFARQEGFGPPMLPRITAALVQFIAPIISGNSQNRIEKKPDQPFQRFKPKDEKHDPAKVVILAKKDEEPKTALIPRPLTPNEKISVGHGLVQLLANFQQHRLIFMKWFGSRAYSNDRDRSKKGSKIKKGSILDQKAS